MPPRKKAQRRAPKTADASPPPAPADPFAPSWATLVPELLSEVQQILVDEYTEQKAEKDACVSYRMDRRKKQRMPRHPLLTATLVNRHWNAVATSDLYKSIYVHQIETIRQILRSCTKNASLIDHIKSVSIDYKYNNLPTQPKAQQKEQLRRKRTAEMTWKFLQLLKPGRLRHMSIHCLALEPVPADCDLEVPPECLIGLKSLDCVVAQWGYFRWWNPLKWIEMAAPSLERLKAPLGRFNWNNASGGTQGNCSWLSDVRLKSLCIPDGYGDIQSDNLRALVKHSALEDLSLGSIAFASCTDVEYLFSTSAPTLRRLYLSATYHPYYFHRSNTGKSWSECLLKALPTFVALEDLQLGRFCFNKFEDFVQALPPSVRRLSIARPHLDSADGSNLTRVTDEVTAVLQLLDLIMAEVPENLPNLVELKVYAHSMSPVPETEEYELKFLEHGIRFQYYRETTFPNHLPWTFRL